MTQKETMIRIGITGQSGFVGTHLFNTLGLYPDEFECIPFEDSFFQNEQKLTEFVCSCDTIVHLAALNRHNNPDVIYNTNIQLVKQLIRSCEIANIKPHILFSSSTQEEKNNPYGNSKREGHELFKRWSLQNKANFTGLVIPNVFGPFGNPYYNSFIATFCHQLTHGERPVIQVDGDVKLIYVAELVQKIIEQIKHPAGECYTIQIPHTSENKVSEILKLLEQYSEQYFYNGIIPSLDNPFERNLFNTFVCYINHASFFPFMLKKNSDNRGSFVEIIKLNSGGQVSFSTTLPDITRGNHFHIRKAERFAVIKGKARIDLRRIGTEKVLSFELDGKNPSFVDMPIWFTHNITNIGDEELYTMFWISEHFDVNDPDTFFETV